MAILGISDIVSGIRKKRQDEPRPFRYTTAFVRVIASLKQLRPAVAYAMAHLDEDVSLSVLAAQAGISAFHLHRLFSGTMQETPKQLTLRLRLGRAAVMLLTGRDSVLDVALACGFQSHEVFCRAFRRRFGITPRAYRERGFAGGVSAAQAREHAAVVDRVGPCIRLYQTGRERTFTVNYSIEKRMLSPQRVLVVRRRVKRSEIASTIAEVLPHIFLHAQQNGIALNGLPFTRYPEVGPGMMTIEPGMRMVDSSAAGAPASDSSEVRAETLPAGPAAVTMHIGPYDKLSDAYGALEEWIQAQGLTPAGAPWESYVTDPGEYPDPKDWKTEVYWPVRS